VDNVKGTRYLVGVTVQIITAKLFYPQELLTWAHHACVDWATPINFVGPLSLRPGYFTFNTTLK